MIGHAKQCVACVLLILLVLGTCRTASAQSSFAYTGSLVIGGTPANGAYDFEFELFNAPAAGAQVGSTLTLTGVNVAKGVFNVTLDFAGNSFANAPLYLQTYDRLSGGAAYKPIAGRVLMTTRFSLLALLSGNTLALQGYPVSSAAPTSGQALVWNGLMWTPATVSGGASYQAGAGLALKGNIFSIASGGVVSSMLAGAAVTAPAIAAGAVTSSALAAGAVRTSAIANGAVTAAKMSGSGASAGQTLTYNGSAVIWSTPGGGFSLPYAGSVGGANAAFSVSNSGDGDGVDATSMSGTGVYGVSTSGVGISGATNSSSQPAVFGYNLSGGPGVYGVSIGSSIYGFLGGNDPIFGENTGVFGTSSQQGVFGWSGSGGTGVYGGNSAGGYGVRGESSSGIAVSGVSSSSAGGYFTSSTSSGVYGETFSGDTGTGGEFYADSERTGNVAGVYGESYYGTGLYGFSYRGDGVYGETGGTDGWAGYFYGSLFVQGQILASIKDFRIDHPLDPANKYLTHSCVESDQMANLYSGNVTTNQNGSARVLLPDWFEALNKDFRYQLTVIGQFAQAIIATEIADGRFTIKTDKPNVKVSWQVTGIRKDAYANAHPLEVEQDKPADKRGTYLHPEEQGFPENRGEGYAHRQTMHERSGHAPH